MTPSLYDRAKAIELLVLDVDGVLSDSSVIYSEAGETIKKFSVRDGLGLRVLQAGGIGVAIITGRESQVLALRAADLGIEHVYMGKRYKKEALDELVAALKLDYSQVAYMGDDVNDLSCLKLVGLPMAPSDAVLEVLRESRFIANSAGGNGAVREACELIAQSKGIWTELVNNYFAL